VDKDFNKGQKFTFDNNGKIITVKPVNASALRAAKDDMLPNKSFNLPELVDVIQRTK
jgi:hypothetical protein